MIPLHLTIKGLYSYQEKQIIDFTRLTSASIFGIFGIVGSGKSSILEAITFALFGKTERLNLSGDNRNYNMMNLKSDELLIEFRFRMGGDAAEYLVTVKGRRNSKKFEDVKTLDRNAYKQQHGQWIPISTEELEASIGLSYENFKRTIIIPQGKFQEFLQLGKSERTQMMKELFSLEKYELFYKTVSVEQKNTAALNILQGKLHGLQEANPELIPVYESSIAEWKQKVEINSGELAKMQKEKQVWDELKTLVEKVQQAKTQSLELEKKQPEYIRLEREMIAYEKCLIDFKPLLDVLEDLKQRKSKTYMELAREKELLASQETNLKKKTDAFEALKPVYEKREGLKSQSEELAKLEEIKMLSASMEVLQKRIGDGNQHAEAETEKLIQEKKNLEQLTGQQSKQKEQLPDISRLHEAKAWFQKKSELNKQLQELNPEFLKLEKEKSDLLKQEIDIRQWTSKLSLKWENLESLIELIPAYLQKLEQQLEQLNETIEHARVQSKLAAYAEELKQGDPCPLCGATHHPQLFNADESEAQLNKWLEQRETLKEQLQIGNQWLQKVREFLVIEKNRTNLKQALTERKKRLQDELALHLGNYNWNEFSNEEHLKQLFDLYKQLEIALKKLETEIVQSQNQVVDSQQKIDKYKAAIDGFKMELASQQAKQETLKNQIKILDWVKWQQKSLEAIREEKERLDKEYISIEKQFVQVQQAQEQIKLEVAKLQEKVKSLSVLLEGYKKDFESKQRQIQEKLIQSSFDSIEIIQEILIKKLNISEIKQQIEVFKEKMVAVKQRIKDLEHQIQNREYNPEAHFALEKHLVDTENQLKEAEKVLIETMGLLKKLQEDLEKKALLFKEKEQLEQRAEAIKTLKNLFKGNGFVNYISTVHLQNLCKVANERFFKLTGQKLSLEITPDNSFQVRDFMNNGKVRHVKTLSGGQTFQASLSLALALADSVNKLGNSKENFFFLDEGFGNLDMEALQVVFNTLKTLRNENRIVGIISHVEELQNEIDAHIRVLNDPEKGSFIREH